MISTHSSHYLDFHIEITSPTKLLRNCVKVFQGERGGRAADAVGHRRPGRVQRHHEGLLQRSSGTADKQSTESVLIQAKHSQ